jgi:pyrroline-5-carboxylate reductase
MTVKTPRIAFIGAGNMASALITGLLTNGYKSSQLLAMDPSPEQRELIASKFGIQALANITDPILASADICVLATKPQQLADAATALAAAFRATGKPALFISIAAGIRLGNLSAWLGEQSRIVRTMPNTPALIGQGITGMYANSFCSEQDRRFAQEIMQACGKAIWLEQESLLDAVTAISGSGPAYVFYFIEALQAAGAELGLSDQQARELAIATFSGAASLAAQSTEPLAQLRERVTSKGGTTFAALEHLRSHKVGDSIHAAALAAARRAKELVDEFGS